ncbi:glycosyltransferase family 2 protein [Flavobacterium sp. JP2137]|uniref:glycosyltransferase family 2 protein n=1 Tax=Flavobacterium sp. JP2137 TaxID=3414510 RepID=UPI003D2FFA6A
MVSLIIPTYRYEVYPLVKRLHQECLELGLIFEILCSDDASPDGVDTLAIEALSNCRYYVQPNNLGLSYARNFLIDRAQYDCIILLDCDTLPVYTDFVKRYVDAFLNQPASFFSGGLQYQAAPIATHEILRWVYGNSREAVSATIRQQHPYEYSLCSNICFSKKGLREARFQPAIKDYGYEDLVFFKALEKQQISVCHLDNPVFHLKLESSQHFLDKTKTALKTLESLVQNKLIDPQDTTLLKAYRLLKTLQLTRITAWIFTKTQGRLEKNLLSGSPSLWIFDLYKLGYFCSLQGLK